METYILDTNLFFNMQAGLDLGQKTEEVIINMTKGIKKAKEHEQGMFLIPPRIVDEFLSFFENKQQPFLQDFLSTVTVQSPKAEETMLPASIFYKLVEDIRARSYRGLTAGEEELQKTARLFTGKEEMNKMQFEMNVGPLIKSFRERYRQATRFGFIDSLADLDLIMLAKETEGMLVSADEGVIKWGRTIGVREMQVPVFGKKMKEYLRHRE